MCMMLQLRLCEHHILSGGLEGGAPPSKPAAGAEIFGVFQSIILKNMLNNPPLIRGKFWIGRGGVLLSKRR